MNGEAMLAGQCAYHFLGFIGDGRPDAELLAGRGPYLGGLGELGNLPTDTQYIIAIGDGRVRQRIDQQVTELGLRPATLIHPAATFGRHGIVIGPAP